ncbi:MAG TPA: ATP-binding protein [Candidatus Polarisedimenticolia bacterium]|nr:ATP-binding protein [Candidatus Polarisedimenticolia bacterium]
MKTKRPQWKRQLWLVTGGVIVVMLAAVVITLGSFHTPLRPEQENAFVILFALSTLIGAALLVFTLILSRSLLRLWAERRSGQIGSRFKVKMVLGAMGVSLLPVVFLFFFSYALVNRTLNTWFPRPLEIANEQGQALVDEFTTRGHTRMSRQAESACALIEQQHASWNDVLRSNAPDANAMWFVNPDHSIGKMAVAPIDSRASVAAQWKQSRTLPSGAEVWMGPDGAYLASRVPCLSGALIVARAVPLDFLQRYDEIESQTTIYQQQKQHLRAYKRQILWVLLLVTILLLFATTWVALFLSKQVTVPIQALAEATREISRGNFDHRIEVRAQDELGILVRSFNRMTEQLGEGRRQINEFTRSLEQAIEEREGRRKLMEAILENIPTGVISLDASGAVTRVNSAVVKILGDHARLATALSELLGDEAARDVLHLMRRSLRMGAASREIEIATNGRLVRTAVTVSSLGPRRSNTGFVVVIDDLTDLLQAQKAAAWQEVAQRIAHEIKNPLTPIQLSAQRLLRYLDRAATAQVGVPPTEFEKLAAECARLIEREVQTLESLVKEFSQFARFPAARLAPADLNSIVESALGLFQGRLEGITVRKDLSTSLPPVKADPELMRQVIANLIDNAAEAMEASAIRQLRVTTRARADGDAVEVEICDSGHGISPTDKEKLFLPHFSTKERGTGLGLAIASRIVAEHNGTIRVEDNLPTGSRFVIRFPAVEVAMPTQM